MSEATAADLRKLASYYNSSRAIDQVLVGEDEAEAVIKICDAGTNAELKDILSKPEWTTKLLQEQHWIYHEDRPSTGPGDIRRVMAMPIPHLQRAVTISAKRGHYMQIYTLLDFARERGVKASSLILRQTVQHTIDAGTADHAEVIRAMAHGFPGVVHLDIAHNRRPISEAIKRGKTECVQVLLRLGADPLYPRGFNLTDLQLKRPLPVAETGALHTAAARGRLDTMRLLLENGADVNEVFPKCKDPKWSGWTPLHVAAASGRTEAIELLRSRGANMEVTDKDGKRPAQILEEWRSSSKAST